MKNLLIYLGCCVVSALELALIVGLILGTHLLIDGCKPKSKSQSIEVHINEEDSTRKKLEINVEGANNTVIVSQETSQSAVTDYEKAKKKFDQSRVALPEHPDRGTP